MAEQSLEQQIKTVSRRCARQQSKLDADYEKRRQLWVAAREADPPVPFRTIADWSGVTASAVTKVLGREPVG